MNLIEITERFPTELEAVKHFEKARWGKKPKCAYCDSKSVHNRAKDMRFLCKDCGRSFSVTVNTQLHNTRLPLKTWLFSFAIIADAKKGLSALQLQRNLGISYPTAWSMYHKIRDLMIMENEEIQLDGVVEMDETMLGGKPRKNAKMLLSNTEKKGLDKQIIKAEKQKFEILEGSIKKKYPLVAPKRGRGANRPKVAGIVQRDGLVIAQVMKDLKYTDLKKLVEKHVDTDDSLLITDEYKGYSRMSTIIEHIQIDHQKAYSYKGVNTNTIESFWAIIKRGLVGQYHQVSLKHLPKYVSEFVFKYNNRMKDDMFETLVRHAVKPITL